MTNWISLKEREPEYNEPVLCYMSCSETLDRVIQEVLHLDGDRDIWTSNNHGYFWHKNNVTHWMPLPEKPEKESHPPNSEWPENYFFSPAKSDWLCVFLGTYCWPGNLEDLASVPIFSCDLWHVLSGFRLDSFDMFSPVLFRDLFKSVLISDVFGQLLIGWLRCFFGKLSSNFGLFSE